VKEVWTQQLSQEVNAFSLATQPTITTLHGQVYVVYQGQQIATWDGTNQSGDPVTNGKYYVKVDNTDPMGVVTSVSQTVLVSRSLAKISVNIYNEAGEIVRHLYAYVDDPSNNVLQGVQLSSSVIRPSVSGGTNGTVSITSSNGMTLVWDGRSDTGAIVTNGRYQVVIQSNDGKGGQQTLIEGIVVESPNTAITDGKVYGAPNIVKGGVATTDIRVNSTINYTLTARLYDTAGELVRQAATGTAGANSVTVDLANLGSGLYFVVVDLTDPSGNMAGHQVTQIVIQR
jgi:flagellar hook assembly protein FlgD